MINSFAKIFSTSLFFFFLTIFIANSQSKISKKIEKLSTIKWYHSHEEVTKDDILIYRPATFNFPPTRGRQALELKKGGLATWFQIAPTDGLEPINAYWKGNILAVGAKKDTQLYKILKITDQILTIQKLKK